MKMLCSFKQKLVLCCQDMIFKQRMSENEEREEVGREKGLGTKGSEGGIYAGGLVGSPTPAGGHN
jgi:hypothetical protein